MKQVIGQDGCFFKQLTQRESLDFLWHNKKKQCIEIWGDQQFVVLGKHAIQNQIDHHVRKMYPKRRYHDCFPTTGSNPRKRVRAQ